MIMGKYNLGKSTTGLRSKLTKDELYINEVKISPVVNSLFKELGDVVNSLQKIDIILNKSVKMELVKGNRAKTFKAWAKKCKGQANNAIDLKGKLIELYSDDVVKYPIKLLDDRIAELEKKIENMSK